MAAVVSAVVVCRTIALAAPVGRARPNLVFIILDDMHRDMMSWTAEGRGRTVTPNLDRLAVEGTVMAEQHIVSPVCSPSRFTCLTGRYASRCVALRFRQLAERAGQTVVVWNTDILRTDVTLPKLLQAAGYRTGFAGKNHTFSMPKRPPIPEDGDPADPAIAAVLQAHGEAVRAAIRAGGFDFAGGVYPANPDELRPRALRVHNMDWVAAAALEFIETAPTNQPFFLYFAPTLCHAPYEPERSWQADPRVTPEGLLDKAPRVLPPRSTLPERVKAAGVQGRDREMLLWLDDAIGAVMSRIEARGAAEQTLVFVVNDNGQEGKGSIYQSGTHSPSIVWRHGGFPCGPVCTARVSNIDFAPTLLDFAGVPAPPDAFDGISFRSALEGGPWRDREALYFELGFTRGVRIGDWKYIALRYRPHPERVLDLRKPVKYGPISRLIAERAGPHPPPYGHIGGNDNELKALRAQPAYFDPDQLYDLASDPSEQTNLAARTEFADRLADMQARSRRFLDELPGGFGELKPAEAGRAAGEKRTRGHP